MSSKLRDILAKKKAALASKAGGFKPIKPKDGKSVIRILPSWRNDDDEPFYHDFGQHWIKTVKNGKPVAVFVCPEKTFEKECEVCAAIQHGISVAEDRGDDEQVDLLKDCNAQQTFLVNVLVLSDKENRYKPQTMAMGSRMFDQVINIWTEYMDEIDTNIVDVNTGVNLVVTREGSGFDTKYTVVPHPKGSTSIGDQETIDEVLAALPNLDDLIEAEFNRGSEQKALNGVGTACGIMPPATGGKGRKAIEADFDDIDEEEFEEEEAEDAEFEEVDDLLDEVEEEEPEPEPVRKKTAAKKAPAKKAPAKKAPAKKSPGAAGSKKAEPVEEDDDLDDLDDLLAELDEAG